MSLLIPVLAAGVYYAYTKFAQPAAAANQLIPEFQGVQINKLDGYKLKLNGLFNFVNPSNQVFTISNIYIEIKSQGNNIAKILFSQSIKINPNTEKNKFSIPFDLILTNLPSYLTSSSTKLQAVGYITANGMQFKINETFDFDISSTVKTVQKAGTDIVKAGQSVLNYFSSIPSSQLNDFLQAAKNGSFDAYKHASYRIYETNEVFNPLYVVIMSPAGDEFAYNYRSIFKTFEAVPLWNKLKAEKNPKLLVNELIK